MKFKPGEHAAPPIATKINVEHTAEDEDNQIQTARDVPIEVASPRNAVFDVSKLMETLRPPQTETEDSNDDLYGNDQTLRSTPPPQQGSPAPRQFKVNPARKYGQSKILLSARTGAASPVQRPHSPFTPSQSPLPPVGNNNEFDF